MSVVNKKSEKEDIRVAGQNGKIAAKESDFSKLKRLIGLSIIGEEKFYPERKSFNNAMEDIATLSSKISNEEIEDFVNLLMFTRTEIGLRYSTLFALIGAMEGGKKEVIEKLSEKFFLRPTDITDLLSIYISRGNKKTLPKKLKRLIEKALNNYDEYQYNKYGRKKSSLNFNLVDVFNLVHPKANDKIHEELFKKVIDQNLSEPETWEHLLSNEVEEIDETNGIILPTAKEKRFKTKKEAWEFLLETKKLPSLAALRNISNMESAGVSTDKILNYIKSNVSVKRIFPLQILTAYEASENKEIKKALIGLLNVNSGNLLKGETLIVLDISGSMGTFSSNIELRSLATRAVSVFLSIANNIESFELAITSGSDYERKHKTKFVKEKGIFKDIESFLDYLGTEQSNDKLGYGGIFTYQALEWIKEQKKDKKYKRVIVISDSQDCDNERSTEDLPILGEFNYINNIAAYKHVGYNETTNGFKEITTFSSKIVDFINYNENMEN